MHEIASTNFMKVAGVNQNGAVQTTSFNTDAFVVGHARVYAIEAIYTGTTTGTFTLQASNDPVDQNAAPSSASWTNIDGSIFDLAVGSPILWNIVDPGYNFVRLSHTDTGGGNLTITLRITTRG